MTFTPTRVRDVTCNRTFCRQLVEVGRPAWWNIMTNAWYCQPCAFKINSFSQQPILFREDKPEAPHP